jgi:hypothetical protein
MKHERGATAAPRSFPLFSGGEGKRNKTCEKPWGGVRFKFLCEAQVLFPTRKMVRLISIWQLVGINKPGDEMVLRKVLYGSICSDGVNKEGYMDELQ